MSAYELAARRRVLCQQLCRMRSDMTAPVRRVIVDIDHPTITIETDIPERVHLDFPHVEWVRWARATTAIWWAVSEPLVHTQVGQEPFTVGLINHSMQKVWEGEDATIYGRPGQGFLYWMCEGLQDWEAISASSGMDYAVVSVEPLSPAEEVRLREYVLWKHPGQWKLPDGTEPSTTMTSRLALEEAVAGALRPLVETVALWLRETLPELKIGAPTVDDVRQKLRLERRLRVESGVVGSTRPLAFTLEALEEPVSAWPGLWYAAAETGDVRSQFPILLMWDAVLQTVNAIARTHVEAKPGLCGGDVLSRSLIVRERRFSKREVAVTDAAYCQVNPQALLEGASTPPVLAARLLQLASHEISHLVSGATEHHGEMWARRREQILFSAQGLTAAVQELVKRVGILGSATSLTAVPYTPIALWLHDTLVRQPVVTMEQLVQAWRAVRFLTEGKAERDLVTELERCEQDGTAYRHQGLVISTLVPATPV